jgi:hypothetical protein
VASGPAVTAADIDYSDAGFYPTFLSHDFDQMSHRNFRTFVTCHPKPVMHVFTPKLSIKYV